MKKPPKKFWVVVDDDDGDVPTVKWYCKHQSEVVRVIIEARREG